MIHDTKHGIVSKTTIIFTRSFVEREKKDSRSSRGCNFRRQSERDREFASSFPTGVVSIEINSWLCFGNRKKERKKENDRDSIRVHSYYSPELHKESIAVLSL